MEEKDYFKKGYEYALSINESEDCALFLGQQYHKWMNYFLTEEYCVEEPPTEVEYQRGCKEQMEFSIDEMQVFKKHIGYGHSVQFATLVAICAEEDEGLDAAYNKLTPDEAYKAAYKQYEIQGKSKLYCDKIAATIKGRKEYPVDFRTIESIIEEFEVCYNDALKRFDRPDLADFYAELVSFDDYRKTVALGIVLMKSQLIYAQFSTEYIDLFMTELLFGRRQYDEIDESTFLPNAKDLWHISIIYGEVDSYFVAKQNDLSDSETKKLQNISESFYYSLTEITKESRLLAIKETITKYNIDAQNKIIKWEIE